MEILIDNIKLQIPPKRKGKFTKFKDQVEVCFIGFFLTSTNDNIQFF